MHTELIDESRQQTLVELTASRDGRHFARVGNREVLIPMGDPGDWDPHYHAPTSAPRLVGDEIWIYYFRTPVLEENKVGEAAAQADKEFGYGDDLDRRFHVTQVGTIST